MNIIFFVKDINIEKKKLKKEKWNEEERIKDIKEFDFRKSFYNSNVNKKMKWKNC